MCDIDCVHIILFIFNIQDLLVLIVFSRVFWRLVLQMNDRVRLHMEAKALIEELAHVLLISWLISLNDLLYRIFVTRREEHLVGHYWILRLVNLVIW